jgi:hypothetical protein
MIFAKKLKEKSGINDLPIDCNKQVKTDSRSYTTCNAKQNIKKVRHYKKYFS